MPICPLPDRWNAECHSWHCGFHLGYVYGLYDARISDIFYVGSTVQRPGVRYSGHMSARSRANFREAWILAILADGSLPVFVPFGEFQTECEQELKQIENAIAAELRAMGHTAMCDVTRPALRPYRTLCPIDWRSHVYRAWEEQAIAEHLALIDEQARVVRYLREIWNA